MTTFNSIKEARSYIVETNESGATAVISTTPEVAVEILNNDRLSKYELQVNGDSIKRTASSLEKALFTLRNANSAQMAEDACFKLSGLLFEEFVSFGAKGVKSLIINNKPSEQVEAAMQMMSATAHVFFSLERKLAKQTEIVKSYISTSDSFEVMYNDIDESLFEAIESQEDVVFALTHPMGFGKTSKVTKRLFDEYSAKEGYAVGISPKRILTSLICDDERNYKNINATSSKKDGVFGVINSVIMNHSLEDYREGANIVIAEEHEEIIAQATGRAVADGKLLSRAELLEGYMELIKKTDKVVLMDAMFSEESAKMIERTTGKKVIIVKPASEVANKVTVRLMTETTNVAIANQAAIAGKNVLAFSDAKNKGDNSELSVIYNSITKDAKSGQLITANTISELKDEVSYIKDIENVIASKQVTVVSPVINSGVSITNGHADSVHIFSNQVMSLKGAIQTIRRDRKAEVINLSINIAKSRPNTSSTIVLADEIMRDSRAGGLTEDMYKAYKSNKSVSEVIESIVAENKVKCDYKVNMIIALRLLGFNVEFFQDEDLQEDGKQAKVVGKELEEVERIEGLMSAEKITEKEATKINSENYITNAQKFEVARFEIESTYQEEISEELIDFDKKGSTRRKFENNLIANNKRKVNSKMDQFKKDVICELFAILNIDAGSISGVFSKNDADEFVAKFSKEAKLTMDGMTISGEEAFKIVFKEALPKGHSTSVVSKVLSSKFGIKTASAGKKTIDGKRVNMYAVDRQAMSQEFIAKLERIYNK